MSSRVRPQQRVSHQPKSKAPQTGKTMRPLTQCKKQLIIDEMAEYLGSWLTDYPDRDNVLQ